MAASILARSSSHYFRQHPWQTALAITGIALAVAVVVSIDLVINSAQFAFEGATRIISGNATHSIEAEADGLDESIYTQLKLEHSHVPIAPVIETRIQAGQGDVAQNLTLLGVDPFAETGFREFTQMGRLQNEDSNAVLLSVLTEPGTVLIDAGSAARLQVSENDHLDILVDGRRHRVRVVGVIVAQGASDGEHLNNLMLTDIASAQELLDMDGRISRIDVRLAEDNRVVEAFKTQLPAAAHLRASSQRQGSLREMTRAFHINLKALSLLALLVGMFLIYNTMQFMVLQRRRSTGMLRALGATSGQLFQLTLNEALFLGLLASAIGLLAGILLAGVLLDVVSRTVNEIYQPIPDAPLTVSPLILMKTGVLGVVGTVIATLPAAFESTLATAQSTLQRSTIEEGFKRVEKFFPLLGGLSLLLGALLIEWNNRSITLGFAAIFVIIAGLTLLTPTLMRLMLGCVRRPLSRLAGMPGRHACRAILASMSRTTAAVAALMIAIATLIGIGLMVNNFRTSVNDWLNTLLRADLYLALEGPESNTSRTLNENLRQSILTLPGVTNVSSVLRFQTNSSRGQTAVAAYGLTDEARQGFAFIEGDQADIWSGFDEKPTVLVSEPYAWRHQLSVGGHISLHTAHGPQEFRISGIYRDYSSEQGVVAMSQSNYELYWRPQGYSGLGVYVTKEADRSAVAQSIRSLLPDTQLWIQDRQHLLQSSLAIFDNTFVITEILRVLAGIIAFIGVFSALMALQLERSREHGLLRALGLLPRQLYQLVMLETSLLGLLAGVLAVPLGCLITALLVLVINQRSFGWSMSLHFSADIILQGVLLGMLAALLAGLYPARRMARTPAATALRME